MLDVSLKKALDLHQKHDLDAAEKMYVMLHSACPDDPGVMHAYAILLGQSKRFGEGINLAKHLVKLCSSPQHHNTLANLYKKNKQLDLAFSHYRQALLINDDYGVAMNNIGALHLKLGQLEDAARWLRRALHVEADYIDAKFNLALVLARMEKTGEAIECLRDIVAKDPVHAQAWMQLGLLYANGDDAATALDCFENRLNLDPDSVDALFHQGVCLHKLNQLEKSIQSFERCIVLQPEHLDAHHNVASTYVALQQGIRALPHYLFMVQHQPEPSVLFNIGVIYMHQEQHQDAIVYFMEALRLDSAYLQSHINLAGIYLKLNDPTKARFHYQAAQAIDPDSNEYAFILTAIDQQHAPEQPPHSYVSHLFDSYADAYDVHLSKYLRYQLPELIHDALTLLDGDATHFENALDIGCGTGLAGEAIVRLCGHMVGIDLSDKMLAVAKIKNIYQQLHHASYDDFLSGPSKYDLLVAADVMPYIGDPDPFIERCAAVMRRHAYLVFSIEITEQYPYTLQPSIRYAHNARAISEVLVSHGLKVVDQRRVTARYQNNKPVPSQLWVVTPL